MRPFRLFSTAASGIVAVLLVAGCGSDSTAGSGAAASSSPAPSPTPTGNGVADLSADQILAKAKAALAGAESTRIKGSGGQGQQKFDLDMRYSGADSTGTFGINGQTVELRKVGAAVYLKGSREFYTGIGGEGAAQLLAGKWLKTPQTDKRFADLAEIADLSKAAEGILDPDGTITKGGVKTVGGVEAITLISKGKDGGNLYVATTGEPYPLRIEPSAASGETGSLTFSDFGKPVTVQVPPADQVVDVSKLPGS